MYSFFVNNESSIINQVITSKSMVWQYIQRSWLILLQYAVQNPMNFLSYVALLLFPLCLGNLYLLHKFSNDCEKVVYLKRMKQSGISSPDNATSKSRVDLTEN
ncbi:Bacteriochlorophyll synthase 44chain [Trichinella spiralis]|uniref:Bacteriochlorophyll synthase 44chain n=1 Tax=Trichinella spiralis TaxID=6334 RepID=A0ABR3KIU4_TRISP